MKCIVGLGNPGNRYRFTRHNIGFLFAEHLVHRWSGIPAEGNEHYEAFHLNRSGEEIVILMPQTYMNNSGIAVRDFTLKAEIPAEDILIVFDDFQLPFGTLRLRPSGTDGGHNGMGSIIYHLENDCIPRLRIGVGGHALPDEHTHELMADYVLRRFDPDEEKLIGTLMHHAEDAVASWIDNGIARTMSSFNRNFFNDADAS